MAAHRPIFVALLSISWAACSVDRPVDPTATASQAIIGGALSQPNTFMATGMIMAEGALVCTATLIAPDVALTAAHCLTPPPFGSLTFTFDVDSSNGEDALIGIKLTHQHPDFDGSVDPYVDLAVRNDIGVLVLERPVLDVTPEAIDEPIFETPLDNGTQLAMCGYGWDVWNSGSFARKRDATMVVDRTADFEFSTMATDPQPCNGDSGGPLFVEGPGRRRIAGLVSRAMGRSSMCDTGAIITRVAPYADWIHSASKDRSDGCNAGGQGSLLSLCALGLLVRQRRRTPR
jgi:secreted trypsin-like serine protease